MGLWESIKGFFSKMFSKQTIEDALKIETAMSQEMIDAIELWSEMYNDKANWLDDDIKSLGLPSAIASEVARLVTIEMESEITGSARADYLNEQYHAVLDNIRKVTEYGLAKGGLIFKPYISGDKVVVDYVQADAFYPLEFTKGELTSVCFVERIQKGKKRFTRLETHKLEGTTYTVKNKFYVSDNDEHLGRETSNLAIPEWESLEEELILQNIDKPLFAYFKPALANNVDTRSPLGVSIYSRAVKLIEEADEQYSRMLWEYEGGELAINASIDLFKNENGRAVLPKGKERLYRALDIDSSITNPIQTFSPALRDASLLNGLNAIIMRVEDVVGLARGTFSNVVDTARTATEIKVLRQRTYATITDNQKSLEDALEHLIYAMDVWTTLGNLAPMGTYETKFEWDDSVIVDTETERAIKLQEVQLGLLKPIEYVKWAYGVEDEQALELMPQMIIPEQIETE